MSAATEALITMVADALPSSPPPSPLTPLSSPLPQIPSPPLPVPSPPLPLPSPPIANMPLQKRAHFTAPTNRFEVKESSTAIAARQPRLDVATMDATPGRPMSRENTKQTEAKNGNDSHNSGSDGRRLMPIARECTYIDFLKCQPLNFKGTKGVVLTQWFEKMEYVFHISNCTVKTLKKKMTDKYCPRGKIKKLEIELWNLKVKGNDMESYNQRFQELALMCGRMFPEESDEVEKYVDGLPDMIQGSGLGKRNRTEDLNLYDLNATTIMMDNVLPSAPTARELAISPGIVEASLQLPTTKEPKGQIKEFSLALSVELRAISRVIA
ncbi:putative reverse transcriptase domain-containing protein [Tanacetum coccineum]